VEPDIHIIKNVDTAKALSFKIALRLHYVLKRTHDVTRITKKK
jgi:hypothetical protein